MVMITLVLKSQGIKQLMAGGGVSLIGIKLIPTCKYDIGESLFSIFDKLTEFF